MRFAKLIGHFLGRNGYFKAIGVNVYITHDNKEIWLAPITSKEALGRCEIQIPVEDIPALITEMQEKYDKASEKPE